MIKKKRKKSHEHSLTAITMHSSGTLISSVTPLIGFSRQFSSQKPPNSPLGDTLSTIRIKTKVDSNIKNSKLYHWNSSQQRIVPRKYKSFSKETLRIQKSSSQNKTEKNSSQKRTVGERVQRVLLKTLYFQFGQSTVVIAQPTYQPSIVFSSGTTSSSGVDLPSTLTSPSELRATKRLHQSCEAPSL